MSPETVRALRAINERFYRTQAARFAAKRTRPWPGMERLVASLPGNPGTALDVGCGHGRMAALLAAAFPTVAFTGVDGSQALLDEAAARSDLPASCTWVCLDLLEEPEKLPEGPFGLVTMIATLHHLPGETRRTELLRQLAARVAPGGTLAVTLWRWVGDLQKRAVDPAEVGLEAAELEPGDRISTFDGDRAALRFAHFADEAELARVERAPGLHLAERYEADGPGGDANAYFLWRAPE